MGWKLTEDEVRARVAAKHGGKIQMVEYAGKVNEKSTFRCQRGHEWRTTVSSVVQGYGCAECAGSSSQLTEEQVRERIRAQHNDKIQMLEYAGTVVEKSSFRCQRGHEWQTKAGNVMRGHGCAACAGLLKLTEEQVHARIRETHGDKIQVVEYAGTVRGKSSFRCQRGHQWQATANNVMQGRGCPSCAEHGFAPSKPAWLYLKRLRTVEREIYTGFGITNVPDTREKQHRTTFKKHLVTEERGEMFGPLPGADVASLESLLKDFVQGDVLDIKGFKTESVRGDRYEEIRQICHELALTK